MIDLLPRAPAGPRRSYLLATPIRTLPEASFDTFVAPYSFRKVVEGERIPASSPQRALLAKARGTFYTDIFSPT